MLRGRATRDRSSRLRPPLRGSPAAATGATDGLLDAYTSLPYELALLFAFAAGAATTAAVMSRDAVLGLPLSPLPNAKRLSPAAAPDRILTGSGVVVLQHLLKYFYPGARQTRARYAQRRACQHASSPPDPDCPGGSPGLAAVLATVITRRIQPGLERLQNATLRELRVEDLTLGTPFVCMFFTLNRRAYALAFSPVG